MKSKVLIMLITGLFLCKTGYSTNPKALSLKAVLTHARNNHPTIKMQHARTHEQEANVMAARSHALPHVNIHGAYSNGLSGASAGLHQPAISNSAFRSGFGASLDVEQTLYDFGRIKAKVGAADAGLHMQHWQEKITLADILKKASDSYHECQRAKHYVALYKKAQRNMSPLTREVERFVSTGQRSEVDSYLTQTFSQEINDGLIAARKYEQEALIQFNLAIGAKPFQYTCQGNGHPQVLTAVLPVNQYLDAAKRLRPEMHWLEFAKKKNYFNLKSVQADYWPKLIGMASVGHMDDVNVNLISNKNYVVSIGLNIPLFDGYMTKARIDKAVAQMNDLRYEEQWVSQQMNAEIHQALIQYKESKQLFIQAQKRRTLASKALHLAQERYLNKNGLLIEWQESFRTWMSNEVNYWDIGFAQQKAITQLQFSTGRLITVSPR